jgi:hypothetical protein
VRSQATATAQEHEADQTKKNTEDLADAAVHVHVHAPTAVSLRAAVCLMAAAVRLMAAAVRLMAAAVRLMAAVHFAGACG